MAVAVTARVVIVDARSAFCDLVRDCLTQGEHTLLGQTQNCDEAKQLIDSLHPDLVIVGPHFGEQGLVVCREIIAHQAEIKVILFTAHASCPTFQTDAVYTRMAACIPPESTSEDWLIVIAKVMAGEQLFPYEIISQAFQEIKLTARELQVLKLMTEGKSDRQIAEELKIKFCTVRNHSQHILEKFNVCRRQDAVWWARYRGWV